MIILKLKWGPHFYLRWAVGWTPRVYTKRVFNYSVSLLLWIRYYTRAYNVQFKLILFRNSTLRQVIYFRILYSQRSNARHYRALDAMKHDDSTQVNLQAYVCWYFGRNLRFILNNNDERKQNMFCSLSFHGVPTPTSHGNLIFHFVSETSERY